MHWDSLRKETSMIKETEHPLLIMNAAVITATGEYEVRSVTVDIARQLVAGDREIQSTVGHSSTATVISTLLGREIECNRVRVEQAVGQHALIYKLKGRLAEGQVLSLEELEEMGYDLFVITRTNETIFDGYPSALKPVRSIVRPDGSVHETYSEPVTEDVWCRELGPHKVTWNTHDTSVINGKDAVPTWAFMNYVGADSKPEIFYVRGGQRCRDYQGEAGYMALPCVRWFPVDD